MRPQVFPAAVRRPRKLIGIASAIALLVSSLALQAAPAYAVNTGSISGTASYSSGQSGGPVDSDSITLKLGSTVVATTTTDGNGDYTFTGLADGTYTVVADTPQDLKPAGPVTETVTGGAAVTGADIHFTPVSVAGYWMTASDGGVFAYGAPFHGSAGALKLNKPVVGIDIASDDSGYTMVGADGGVFSYPAGVENSGSAANLKLAASIVGIWTI